LLRLIAKPASLCRFAVWTLAASAVVLGVRLGQRTAGGADSYGYISEAHLWRRGEPWVLQPFVDRIPWSDRWTFTPLGYKPSPEQWTFATPPLHPPPGRGTIVPTYSPGLPLLMAAASRVAGPCAIFWVVPLLGAAFLLATYGFASRLTSPYVALAAAWLTATSPTFLTSLTTSMSDAPGAASWALCWWWVLGGTVATAVGAGIALACAVLIRPNLVTLAATLMCYLAVRVFRADGSNRRHELVRASIVAAGLAAGILVTACINWILYGSPLLSGYGPMGDQFHWANVGPNAVRYLSWFAGDHTILAVIGIVAPALLIVRGGASVRDRAALVAGVVFLIGVWTTYMFYEVFDSPSYLRFLLPTWPLIMTGTAITVRGAWARLRGPLGFVATALAMAVTVWIGIRGIHRAEDTGLLTRRDDENAYIIVGKWVRLSTPDNSVILSMQHSGSLRYYAGRITLRYDTIDPATLDDKTQWLTDHGIRVFAVLADWEVDVFARRFAGQRRVAALEAPLVRMPGTTLFDLGQPSTFQTGRAAGRSADVLCAPSSMSALVISQP